jgi:hypothetical protein
MAAQVIPMVRVSEDTCQSDWREHYLEFLNTRLDRMEEGCRMDSLGDITGAILANRSEILGELALGFVRKRFGHLLEQELFACPQCGKQLRSRARHPRQLETLIGTFPLQRPYFYCTACEHGFYPLDEALGLASSAKQYDIQALEAWLGSEMPFETASEAYQRCTGNPMSTHHLHDCANRVGASLGVLDVCPTKVEVEARIARLALGKHRRPVMMMGIDGAHAPTRAEPSARKAQRGKGDYKEVKGFRLYLIDNKRIIHLISWHQVATDQELAQALQIIKNAGLVPEDQVRLCVVGDGAPWIWNRVHEIFPSAKEVLDFYHCAEYLHAVADTQYGKGTRKAREWVESTFVRLFHNGKRAILSGLKRMTPVSAEAEKQISTTIQYLSKHRKRLDYGTAKRGGYHIGSGAIESANKFIAHVRLKRSGAWWYPSKANNILKLRCARANGTFDRVVALYQKRDVARFAVANKPSAARRDD